MILIQRLVVLIYFGVFFVLFFLGAARVLFADDSTLSKRLADYLKAIIPILLWPLAIFVTRSQRLIKEAMPFKKLRRIR